MRTGHRAVEANGHTLACFTDLRMEAAFLARDAEHPVVVERGGKRETLRVKARYSEEDGVVHLGIGLRLARAPMPSRSAPSSMVEVLGVPRPGRRRGGAAHQGDGSWRPAATSWSCARRTAAP